MKEETKKPKPINPIIIENRNILFLPNLSESTLAKKLRIPPKKIMAHSEMFFNFSWVQVKLNLSMREYRELWISYPNLFEHASETGHVNVSKGLDIFKNRR